MKLDMVFKDVTVGVNFLLDLGNILPEFEILPPENSDEQMRGVDGGEIIILYKDNTMVTGGEVMPVFICSQFCSMIGKYSVWDIINDSVRNKI